MDNIQQHYSHESIKALTEQHRELLAGINAAITGGASLEDVKSLIAKALEQSDDIDSRLSFKLSLPNLLSHKQLVIEA